MPYRVRRKESAGGAVRRIVSEQLDRAIADARDRNIPLDDRVHRLRASLKRARAAVRLVREDVGKPARRDERRMRDIARVVAQARELTVEAETLRRLLERAGDQIDPRLVEQLQEARRLAAMQGTSGDAAARLDEAVVEMDRARARLCRWPVEHGRRAVAEGLEATYRDARRALRTLRNHDAEGFHQWRKTIKRLGYQLRLLRKAAPDLWRALGEPLELLGELLGEAHDFAALQARVATGDGRYGRAVERRRLLALLEEQTRLLQDRAWSRGAVLLALRPRDVASRIDDAWESWRESS
jgi:CHAD domain-containing protein